MSASRAHGRPAPSVDPFYAALPTSARPGTVLRSRRVEVPTRMPSLAWQLVYASTDTLGRPTAMSGTILMPEPTWPGVVPALVSYGVGVHGLTQDAAPSYLMATGTESETPLMEAALRRGWAVAVTDGEGLGMPGPHTYGAGRPAGHAMLDIARAATTVTPGLSRATPVGVWGYSEGGRGAAWAAELAPTYAPDVRLVGVAAGGIPSDLYAVARAIDEGPFAGLNLAVLIGLTRAYERPDLLGILTDRGRRHARRAESLDVVGLVLGCRRPLATLTAREEPWDEPAWRALLERERAGQGAPDVPLYLYHADQDSIVPPRLMEDLARCYADRGVEVTAVAVEAPDHLSGGHLGAEGAVAWLAQRFAARRPSTYGGWAGPAARTA